MEREPKKGKSPEKGRDHRSGGSYRGGDGPDEYGQEPFDDPEEHRRIEKRRFSGGLKATPERYAQAREQWYQMPGSLVRPPMDPPIGAPGDRKQDADEQAHSDEKEPKR